MTPGQGSSADLSVGGAEESLQPRLSCLGPTYSLFGNDMPQNFNALACKTALFRIQLQSVVRQAGQDFVKALHMLRKCGRKYHNIVQITQTRLPFEATKDRVHESFEGSRSVAQAKGHDVKFIQAVWGSKYRLVVVGFVHGYLPVPGAKVEA